MLLLSVNVDMVGPMPPPPEDSEEAGAATAHISKKPKKGRYMTSEVKCFGGTLLIYDSVYIRV